MNWNFSGSLKQNVATLWISLSRKYQDLLLTKRNLVAVDSKSFSINFEETLSKETFKKSMIYLQDLDWVLLTCENQSVNHSESGQYNSIFEVLFSCHDFSFSVVIVGKSLDF